MTNREIIKRLERKTLESKIQHLNLDGNTIWLDDFGWGLGIADSDRVLAIRIKTDGHPTDDDKIIKIKLSFFEHWEAKRTFIRLKNLILSRKIKERESIKKQEELKREQEELALLKILLGE